MREEPSRIASHHCEEIQRNDASKAFEINVAEFSDGWFLQYRTFADEADVHFGEADIIGEQTHELLLAIRYCPYCGIRLKIT
jgi:hypothetical protein